MKLQKLRTQYHEFKHRRELLSQYDLFLCDDRITPMLTKALGKTFLSAKKQPVPIRIGRRSSLRAQICRARESAFLCRSYGDCWGLKLAHTAMTEEEVTANLMAGVASAVDKVPRKWKNIKSVSIQCPGTIALPIYSRLENLPPVAPTASPPPESKEERPVRLPEPADGDAEERNLLLLKNLKRIRKEFKEPKVSAKRGANALDSAESKSSKRAKTIGEATAVGTKKSAATGKTANNGGNTADAASMITTDVPTSKKAIKSSKVTATKHMMGAKRKGGPPKLLMSDKSKRSVHVSPSTANNAKAGKDADASSLTGEGLKAETITAQPLKKMTPRNRSKSGAALNRDAIGKTMKANKDSGISNGGKQTSKSKSISESSTSGSKKGRAKGSGAPKKRSSALA